MKLIVAALFALASTVPAWAQDKEPAPKQDGEKKAPPKDGGDPPVKKPAPPDDGGKVVKKGPAEEPTVSVEEVDTNGDGRISASELKAALGKMYPKKDGGAKEGGDVKKPVNKDGAPVKEPAKDGVKKDFPKETEGERKASEKKDVPKEGGDVKKPTSKDGQK